MSAPTPTDFTVREYAPADVGGIVSLWEDVFGDPEAFIRDFLSLLPRAGSCSVAERNGEIAAMAFLLKGAELTVPGKESRSFGYLYAVATREKYRGFGLAGRVCRAAAAWAEKSGCESIATLPAEDWLYAYYASRIGTVYSENREIITVNAVNNDKKTQTINASEYAEMREQALSGTAHFRFSPAYLALQELLGKHYGGGLYLCDGCLAAGYGDGGTLKISECLPVEPGADAVKAAGSLASALGCEKAELSRPCENGEKYIEHNCSAGISGTFWAFPLE